MPSFLSCNLRRNSNANSIECYTKSYRSRMVCNDDVRDDNNSVTSRSSDTSATARQPEEPVNIHHYPTEDGFFCSRKFDSGSSPVPPAVGASQSTDTSVSPSCDVTEYFHRSIYTTDDYLCLPRRHGGPVVTPDGLKARRSFSDVQYELGLGPCNLMTMHSVPSSSSDEDTITKTCTDLVPTKSYSAASSIKPSTHNNTLTTLNVKNSSTASLNGVKPLGFLSPLLKSITLPPIPSRSWSTIEGGRMSWSSPTPDSNTKEPYWQATPSAASPNLVPGQARTAVGNLVAMSSSSLIEKQPSKTAHHPSPDPPGQSPHNKLGHRKSIVDMVYSPMTSTSQRNCKSNQCVVPNESQKVDCEPTMSHHAKNHVYNRTPEKANIEDTHDWLYSPQEDKVENMFSPMLSHKGKRIVISQDNDNDGNRIHQQDQTNVATPSSYRFSCPETTSGFEVVLSEKKNSTISRMAMENQSTTQSQLTASTTSSLALDGDIRRLKKCQQQRAKQDLIVAALERLQDDIQVVSDVHHILNGDMGWMNSNPKDRTEANDIGLLTGLPDTMRYNVLDKLDLVLQELDSTFPTQISSMASSQRNESKIDDGKLREALQFVKVLIEMSVPANEKDDSSLQGTNDVGHWKLLPGLRSAMGIREFAVTPDARSNGGDASVFSLPADVADDATPMTSNLSLCSTLTTHCNNTHNSAFSPSNQSQRENLLQPHLQNGLDLRHAVYRFSTTLEKLSLKCRDLSEISAASMNGIKLMRLTEEIKTIYVENLLSIKQRDLKSVVDAFEFVLECPDDSCDYLDTDDESSLDANHAMTQNECATSTKTDTRDPTNAEDLCLNRSDASLMENWNPLYAQTIMEEDENINERVDTLKCDDLRREMGSADDRDVSLEERDDNPKKKDKNVAKRSMCAGLSCTRIEV